MSTFQLLTCDVMLGSDRNNMTVVHRSEYDAVTYPEMLILRNIHGPDADAVSNVFDAGYIEKEPSDERNRLIELYGPDVVTKLFPGLQGLPTGDNRIKPRLEGTKITQVKEAPLPTRLRSAAGPDTDSTTPVNYGGTAEQTGGNYYPHGDNGGATETTDGYAAASNPEVVGQPHPRNVRRAHPVATKDTSSIVDDGHGPVSGTDVEPPKR